MSVNGTPPLQRGKQTLTVEVAVVIVIMSQFLLHVLMMLRLAVETAESVTQWDSLEGGMDVVA